MSMVSYVCLRRLGTSVAAAPYVSLASSHTSSLARESLTSSIDNEAVHFQKFHLELPLSRALSHNLYGGESVAAKSIVEKQLFEPLTKAENLVLDNDVYHCCSLAREKKVLASSSATSEGDNVDATGRKRSDKPSEEELESMAARLVYHLSHFYIQQFDYSLFRPDIVHENRITGKTTVGAAAYFRQLNYQKIYGHLRFAFVRYGCLGYSTNLENGVVKIRWQISGMGMLRMVAFYFPKQLYKKENMIKNAVIISEGISYYYIDGQSCVHRHITDNKEEDKEQHSNLTDKLREKVQKLAKKAPAPAAM